MRTKLFSILATSAALALMVLFGTPTDAAPNLVIDAMAAGSAGPFAALGFSGLIVNRANLTSLYQGFKTNFTAGLGQATSRLNLIATTVTSTTGTEVYPWLGEMPGMREWIGDRQINNLAQHKYSITNKDYEDTVSVPRNAIEDDQFGVFSPMFMGMGQAVTVHPDQLAFPLLKAGFTTPCYDGQYYFDTDHPVLDENGNETSVANTDGGAGDAWFLFDSTKPLKPVIFQERKKPNFVALDKEDDANVFLQKKFIYGVDSRCNVGFGFWQHIWGSKQTLNKANYKIAREALQSMKGDHGRPLGIMPDTLLVSPANESAGLEIVNSERDATGATNVYNKTAKLENVAWLA